MFMGAPAEGGFKVPQGVVADPLSGNTPQGGLAKAARRFETASVFEQEQLRSWIWLHLQKLVGLRWLS
jgi:hypothetical protein